MIDCEINVECGEAVHTVRVRDGVATAGHDHEDDERSLVVLGGERFPCQVAADAVHGSPRELFAYEVGSLRGRLVGSTAAIGGRGGPVDPATLPQALRRLSICLAGPVRSDATPEEHHANMVRTIAGAALANASALQPVGSDRVRLAPAVGSQAMIELPPVWLRTVFLVGAEHAAGALVVALDRMVTRST